MMNLKETAQKGIRNLSEAEYKEYTKEYKKFLCNPDNICNCSECPDNIGCSGWQGKYPCGQWRCWVEMHCKQN